jgi:hypothetical protein
VLQEEHRLCPSRGSLLIGRSESLGFLFPNLALSHPNFLDMTNPPLSSRSRSLSYSFQKYSFVVVVDCHLSVAHAIDSLSKSTTTSSSPSFACTTITALFVSDYCEQIEKQNQFLISLSALTWSTCSLLTLTRTYQRFNFDEG